MSSKLIVFEKSDKDIIFSFFRLQEDVKQGQKSQSQEGVKSAFAGALLTSGSFTMMASNGY